MITFSKAVGTLFAQTVALFREKHVLIPSGSRVDLLSCYLFTGWHLIYFRLECESLSSSVIPSNEPCLC